MLDRNPQHIDTMNFAPVDRSFERTAYHGSLRKWLFDRALVLILLVPFIMLVGALMLLNPLFNRGPLFFIQTRMGYQCRPFPAIKFRTMRAGQSSERGAFDELEEARITPLGHLLRRLHLDEVPQVLNVVSGQMSFIGPRPDCFEHAQVYVQTIPGYRARHSVLPGITGQAQIDWGYAQSRDGITRKVAADLDYIDSASFVADGRICLRTVSVMLGRAPG